MMNEEQREIVKIVYNRFMENEDETWDEIDENLEFVGLLTDQELINECAIKVIYNSYGIFRCRSEHPQEFCMAPRILSAVEAILDLYKETKELHKKNRYILEYFLAMLALGLIFNESV